MRIPTYVNLNPGGMDIHCDGGWVKIQDILRMLGISQKFKEELYKKALLSLFSKCLGQPQTDGIIEELADEVLSLNRSIIG